MRNTILILAVITLLLFSWQPVSAQVSVTAVPFLTIEPGARGNGMGNCFAAIADDATAAFWNPAGTAFLEDRHHIALEHSPWLNKAADDMYLEYAGYNQPVSDLGIFSVHLHYLMMGENIYTGPDSPLELGRFNSYDYALSLGYATMPLENVGVGLNFKVIHSHLSDRASPVSGEDIGNEGTGTTFAVDLGVLYKNMIINGLSGAVVIQNLGPNLTYIDASQSDALPRNLRLGLAYNFWKDDLFDALLTCEANKLLVELDEDLNTQITKQAITGVGSEVWVMDMLAGRVGYYADNEGHVTGLTFGAGFKLNFSNYSGELDFAYIPGGELQDYNQKFSLLFSF